MSISSIGKRPISPELSSAAGSQREEEVSVEQKKEDVPGLNNLESDLHAYIAEFCDDRTKWALAHTCKTSYQGIQQSPAVNLFSMYICTCNDKNN